MRILLDSYMPDVAAEVVAGQGLIQLENVIPAPVGYRAVPALGTVVEPASALPAACRGAAESDSSYASYRLGFAATATTLHVRYASGDWNTATGTWPGVGTFPVVFVASDIYMVAIAGNTYPWAYDMTTGIGGSFAVLDGAAGATLPYAGCGARVGQHLVLGEINDVNNIIPGTPNDMDNTIWWSTVGNPTSWPTPGTPAAIAAQSDYRQLGDPSRVQCIIGGDRTGVILQRNCISRMDYTGGVVMFEVYPVVEGVGCYDRGLAVRTPIGIVFIGQMGWMLFDGTSARPIGGQTFNRTFMQDLTAYNHTNNHILSMAVDLGESHVYLASRTNGTDVNRITIWDWQKDEFARIEETIEWLAAFRSIRSGTTVDHVARIGAFDYGDHKYKVFKGSSRTDGVLVTGDIEPNPGGRASLIDGKPISQGSSPAINLSVSVRDDLDDAVSYGTAKVPNAWGRYECNEDGRYYRFKIEPKGNWSSISAIDLEFVPSGDI